MDSYNEFDNIKAEKAKAMKNYQRQLKLKTLLYFLEFCFILALIPSLYNTIPIAKDSVQSLIIRVFHKTFYVFVLTNAMVIALAISFYLKTECNEAKESVYDEYVSVIESRRGFTVIEESPAPEMKPEECSSFDDKEMVYSENAVNNVSKEIVTVDELKRGNSTVVAVVTKHEVDGVNAEKVLRRSVTDLGGQLEADKRKRELRRSETEKYTSPVVVDDMSSEEFRSTIEKFIAMQKRTQLEELKKEARILSHNAQPRVMALSH